MLLVLERHPKLKGGDCRCKDQMDVLIQTQVQQRREQSLQQRSVLERHPKLKGGDCRCKDQMDVLIQTQVQQRREQSLQQRSRVGTAQLPSLAHVLMKIGIPRACTAKACASRGSGLGSTSRDRIPRGPVPPRPALTVYRGEAGQGGFFEMSGPDSVSRKSRTVGGVSYFGSDAEHEQNCRGCFILWKRCGTCARA
ncbi:hypothetical protein DY000_02004873 [Brassica cretica]|uniref:Uncharacterized protein n=1 Tax=Brassica cretica TaxID=69181 RepID=A0ABQ7CAZ7_BRACR|nr:hypothetical protein DY000_02004873 [Brassica cretica]